MPFRVAAKNTFYPFPPQVEAGALCGPSIHGIIGNIYYPLQHIQESYHVRMSKL